jgi:peptidoglycan/xylan/chitin deacetylase (PgdA/CDA1 family)
MYHSVGGDGWGPISVETFRRHLEFLTEYYEVVDLPAVVGPDSAEAPQRRVALTFDDGYLDFHSNVRPLLREFEVPATVFVVGETLVDPGFCHDEGAGYTYMSKSQVEDLVDSDLVTVGNHTQTHPDLSALDTETLVDEIEDGRKRLESRLGTTIDRFSYPYSRFNTQSAEIVRQSHEYAVDGNGWVPLTRHTDPCLIPRVFATAEIARLAWRVSDGRSNLFALLRWLRG